MDFHFITKPKEGEIYSGDGVMTFEDSLVNRFIVIDSLGHGRKAQAVIDKAKELEIELNKYSPSKTIKQLHRHLRNTRGAAVSIVDIHPNKMIWCGVGNVDAKTNLDDINPINPGGIVGYKMRKTREMRYDIKEGFVLIVYTDGISSRFSPGEDLPLGEDAKVIAEFLMDNYRKPVDDSTVLVVKI